MGTDREKILEFMLAINRLDELYYQIGKRLGIHENEFILFYALSDGKAHTQREICDTWKIPRTTINSVTKKTVALGYLRLVPTGHKEKELTLTETGKEYMDRVFSSFFNAENEAFAQSVGPCAGVVNEAMTHFNDLFEKAFFGGKEEK